MCAKQYTRGEIRKNRETWIAFLRTPDLKKQVGVLEVGEARCCLGHGCVALGVPESGKKPASVKQYVDSSAKVRVVATKYGIISPEYTYAPKELMWSVGLYMNTGAVTNSGSFVFDGKPYGSLSELNDKSDATPAQIADVLEAHIEGGYQSFFIPLIHYPEEVTDNE